MQPRFIARAGRRPFRLLEHPRFRAAYDFLLLRCESGEVDVELGKWWDEFQRVSSGEREAMLLKDDAQKKRRRSRSRHKPVSGGEGGDTSSSVTNTEK